MPGLLPYALHHRLLTLVLGLGLVAARSLVLPATQDRSLSRHLRHEGRRHHRPSRQRQRGGRAAGHDSDRAGAQQRAARDRATVAHDLRAVGRRADVRRRHRRLLRPAAGPREAPRRRVAGRRHADARAAVDGHQRVLPLRHRGRRATTRWSCASSRTGSSRRASRRCRASRRSSRSAASSSSIRLRSIRSRSRNTG